METGISKFAGMGSGSPRGGKSNRLVQLMIRQASAMRRVIALRMGSLISGERSGPYRNGGPGALGRYGTGSPNGTQYKTRNGCDGIPEWQGGSQAEIDNAM